MKRYADKFWDGVDAGPFESLRTLRREIATQRNVPAYVVFSDATLRDMARVRPSSVTGLRGIRGVGEKKMADLGQRFLDEIVKYCRENRLELDV